MTYFEEIEKRLQERMLYEIVKISKLQKQKVDEYVLGLVTIQGSLRSWYSGKFGLIRWYYKNRYSVKNISKKLKPREIEILIEKVFTLEGLEIKKKIVQTKDQSFSPKPTL